MRKHVRALVVIGVLSLVVAVAAGLAWGPIAGLMAGLIVLKAGLGFSVAWLLIDDPLGRFDERGHWR